MSKLLGIGTLAPHPLWKGILKLLRLTSQDIENKISPVRFYMLHFQKREMDKNLYPNNIVTIWSSCVFVFAYSNSLQGFYFLLVLYYFFVSWELTNIQSNPCDECRRRRHFLWWLCNSWWQERSWLLPNWFFWGRDWRFFLWWFTENKGKILHSLILVAN